MEKIYTCYNGEQLKAKNRTFYAWHDSSESYEPGQREVQIDSEYLNDFGDGDYEVMAPSKATIV